MMSGYYQNISYTCVKLPIFFNICKLKLENLSTYHAILNLRCQCHDQFLKHILSKKKTELSNSVP